MKRLINWIFENLAEVAVAVCVGAFFVGVALGVRSNGEAGAAFSKACKEIGGTPVHDGRQMACIK